MNAPDVSVVVPAFNAEPWIAEAVRSALWQTDVGLEVVVVDDGSTDRTIDVVRSIGDERVRVVSQGRHGVSRARNVGTKEARGSFLQYLDADDVLTAGTLALRVLALTRSNADVAYTDWIRWIEQADGSYRDADTVSRTLGRRADIDLLTDAWWPPGALMYRREIVSRIGPWREDLPVIQDARFQLDAALTGAVFVHVPHPGVRYRVSTAETLSRRDPRAFLRDCFRNAKLLDDDWTAMGTLDQERRKALLQVYAQVARGLFERDRRAFAEAHRCLEALQPGFVPAAPKSLNVLSRVIGYPAAESVALAWRRVRRLAWRGRRPDASVRALEQGTRGA